eukprot:305477-Pelagomonas_calceolata.AAC.1
MSGEGVAQQWGTTVAQQWCSSGTAVATAAISSAAVAQRWRSSHTSNQSTRPGGRVAMDTYILALFDGSKRLERGSVFVRVRRCV